MMRIILASASPRRKELLAQIGLDFEIIVSNVEEKVTTTVPYEVVEELSKQKAEGVLANVEVNEPGAGMCPTMIIGSDTIVACDGQILGKPKDAEDAKCMLRKLQGRSHEVYTGVTVLYVCGKEEAAETSEVTASTFAEQAMPAGQKVEYRTFHEATKVHFFPMSEAEIEAYVATGDPLDKAGAYGIQGLCARYISGIEGDYNNVVGLPVGRLYQEIKDLLDL